MEKFQDLLWKLFQFDCADLDFGIYRIMNYKRDAIERFISDELPQAITEELQCGDLADRTRAAEELKDVHERVLKDLGGTAVDADGNLDERFRETPIGKEYLLLKAQADHGLSGEALETNIFNHLYSFFSRYYEDGDYISKRRYSRRQRYSIPYNGEEVYLHWANSDQYYIKTAEHFHDYSYKAPNGVTVHFKLKTADVEQNNVKGDKRFFLPRSKEAAWNDKNREIVIPFEYRPLTSQESINYGKRKQQEVIIGATLEEVPKSLKVPPDVLAALMGERRVDSNGQTVTFLEHHLRHYTRRNTSDFFIHKDLKGFLSRELDFYLKNEVLNLDDMEVAGEDHAEGWFQTMRAIRSVASRIIGFLDQIESFQKMLWEKRKFVTETHYCVRVGIIDESLHSEIAACEAQWEEWQNLFGIDEEEPNLFNLDKDRTSEQINYLKNHPTLVLDTKHFSQDFVDRLLASFDDLDSLTDGLLIYSENFQALNFMANLYSDRIKCTYIDPPYNSKTTEILYKNHYKHSSWLSLMDNRLTLSRKMATSDGSHVVAIDENEQEVLGILLSRHFPYHAKICVSIVHNKKGIQGAYFSYNHDFAYFCIPTTVAETHRKSIPQDQWEYTNLRKWGRESERDTAENCFYPIFVEENNIVGFGEVCDDNFHPEQPNISEGTRTAIYPIDSQGIERKWRYARNSIEDINHLLKLYITESGEIQIHKARADKQFKTVWDDPIYIAGDYGTKWLTDLDLKVEENLYPKSVHTVEDSIFALSEENSIILDYFAGSGTTGHAVINLNRENGDQRRFLLVEMGEYFNTVLLPRIKKIIFSPEWKDGKSVRMPTIEEIERSPRIVKYHRLESYEDALNNIEFDNALGQHVLKFDDYLIQYMLQWETKQSATFLNIEKISRPFSYKLFTHSDGETSETVADIPETFNYLLGLQVSARQVYRDSGHRYLVYKGKNREESAVTVIWRETEGWGKLDYTRDRDFVARLELTAGADQVFVNGDSLIPNARALEPLFKSRMFAGVDI